MVLRRADVVEGALRLLDAEGLDALTMRKLSAALNVQGGALYRHFPSKEALLDALAERLLAGLDRQLPAAGMPWQEQTRVMAEQVRLLLLAHRDAARVVVGTYVAGPNTMAGSRAAVEMLCAAGFPPEQAGWIAFAVWHYVLGHTIEEQAQAQLAPGEWLARIEAADPPPGEPLATAMRSMTAADPAERFRFAVNVFISGLTQQLEEIKANGYQAADS